VRRLDAHELRDVKKRKEATDKRNLVTHHIERQERRGSASQDLSQPIVRPNPRQSGAITIRAEAIWLIDRLLSYCY